MKFEFQPMTKDYANSIANWHYKGIYTFYDMDQDVEDMQDLLDSSNWNDCYYAVTDENGSLIGYYCFDQEKETVEIGLGLRPDLTGTGLGLSFIEVGLQFARDNYQPSSFIVNVATFNQRAINVYRKVGFEDTGVFMNETNGGRYEFLRMVRNAQTNSEDNS